MPWMRDREAADPVLAVRIDEIGEAHIGPALALLHLLAEQRQPRLVIAGEHEDVVPSRRQRQRPTRPRAVSQCSAMILSSIACASANRLRALSPTTGSSRIAG